MKKEPAGRRLTDRETDNVNASRGSTTLITAAQTVVKGKSEQQLFQVWAGDGLVDIFKFVA